MSESLQALCTSGSMFCWFKESILVSGKRIHREMVSLLYLGNHNENRFKFKAHQATDFRRSLKTDRCGTTENIH